MITTWLLILMTLWSTVLSLLSAQGTYVSNFRCALIDMLKNILKFLDCALGIAYK